MKLSVIILTHNEGVHIERALNSVARISADVLVVDSGSSDRTVELAKGLGANVVANPWINYATQFNWALGQLPAEADWVLRLDADEIVSPQLAEEMEERLASLGPDVAGICISRRMNFLGRPIRHGGMFPVRTVRIFRRSRGRCEDRWMDEHIAVDGPIADFRGEIVDDNLKPLSWWIDKHNGYSSREAVDLLNLEYRFLPAPRDDSAAVRGPAGAKRWIKNNVYSKLPTGLRALLYFLYRYFVRLGFLDGWRGTAFHVLQGFWYRYLVDTKLLEVRSAIERGKSPGEAVRDILGIRIASE